jgi:hypothetical protein
MGEIIGFCGIPCHECAAFKATQADDDTKRAEVAEMWSKEYDAKLRPEDINCNGCLSTAEPLFGHCKVCGIRKCGLEKKVENCAHCPDYACEQLEDFFNMVPDARKQLDGIRGML